MQVHPAVVQEHSEVFIPGDDSVHGFGSRFDECVETQGVMDKPLTIVNRLPWQSHFQIAAISFDHSKLPNNVVKHLVAAAECLVVHGRAEILEIDPARDYQWSRHDEFEHGMSVITRMIVAMEEDPPVQSQSSRALARRGDEGRVAG